MITLKPAVAARPTCGSSNVNGATPRIENQMTRLRPMRSPTGPPMSPPTATASRNKNRYICADCIDRWNFSMR